MSAYRGYISRRYWARAKARSIGRSLRRFPRDSFLVIRRAWWIARGERERIIEECAHWKARAESQSKRAAAAEHAVFMLKVEHRGASVDVLRLVADEIDCGDRCENVGPMDMETGVRECRLSDRGECPFDNACALRDLAAALETHAEAVRS